MQVTKGALISVEKYAENVCGQAPPGPTGEAYSTPLAGFKA